ncbi:hypothetical protein [Methyloglobulus sp.]|uniref:hypothetical protein n=1 Tax=Methyloglobulus sp. TaxID=2518622 RepID=UPI0032B79640
MKNISVLSFCLLGLWVIMGGFAYPFYFIDFPSFPVKDLRYDLDQPIAPFDCLKCPERFPLSSTIRIVLSVIWYGLLLAVLSSIPLSLAKCFKSNSFYQTYKTFWLWGALVFSLLTAALTGIGPLGELVEITRPALFFGRGRVFLLPIKLFST